MRPDPPTHLPRRRFLVVAANSLAIAGCGSSRRGEDAEAGKEPEVSPTEDLMREHGLLDRVLLIYEEALRQPDTPWPAIAACAGIVRSFIEDYHEKLEEEHLFPRLERAGKEVDLVATLRRQHQAGRALTERIAAIAGGSPRTDDRAAAAEPIGAFIRMYRPHAAREDTVLFPAFRAVIPASEYAELGERFEDREHQLFGRDGFEGMVAKVADIERSLGIGDLARFTPAANQP
jgi:hemerythrin-like domain-containing protein